MVNFDAGTGENTKEHNPDWPLVLDHYDGSGSEKANALVNLINHQPDIVKVSLYTKDPYKLKYQYLISVKSLI